AGQRASHRERRQHRGRRQADHPPQRLAPRRRLEHREHSDVEGFVRAASDQKWLELHGIEHWTEYYTDYGVALQREFFDHFLKGEDNGWDRRPPVLLRVRTVDGGFVDRSEHEWPLARTRWSRWYLDADDLTLGDTPPAAGARQAYEMLSSGLTFTSPAMEGDVELTGPVAARLFLSSSTSDADVFVTVRVFDPEGQEVLFQGAIDPKTPIAQGWLRASHRALEPNLSTDIRPYHTHREIEPLTPGDLYQLDVEIWPTCLVVPAGHRIAVTVAGRDFDHGQEGSRLAHFANELRGCGPFIHDDPRARPADVVEGQITLYTGGAHASYLMLPVIPPSGSESSAPGSG
ncbi:MAG TPA: CocE/NonD family hydrolase C-terminal non-catalytic domain-containing protein, partial [Euzebyales bacterium]|nr:CocE/NonD family hydrolase C-terminal non-catalytic domain-containing protein [Euzebyales bacterium]